MLCRAVAVLTSLGLLFGGALCLCTEGHEHGDLTSPLLSQDHGHRHSEGSGSAAEEPSHSSTSQDPSHEHGEGEPCDCAGAGEEIVAYASGIVMVDAQACSTQAAQVAGSFQEQSPFKERLLPFAFDSSPPRLDKIPLLFKHHRLNL